jgi:hypothetical protein
VNGVLVTHTHANKRLHRFLRDPEDMAITARVSDSLIGSASTRHDTTRHGTARGGALQTRDPRSMSAVRLCDGRKLGIAMRCKVLGWVSGEPYVYARQKDVSWRDVTSHFVTSTCAIILLSHVLTTTVLSQFVCYYHINGMYSGGCQSWCR